MLEGVLRLCAHLKQTRCLSNRLIGHLKDMLLDNTDQTKILINIIQSCSSVISITDELRELAESEAKSIYNKIFSNITLEELHLLASMGTARIMKDIKNKKKYNKNKNKNSNNLTTSKDKDNNDNTNDDDDFESDTQALVYGEIEYDPFKIILDTAINGLSKCNKFVDLGSGCGRALFMTALLTDFKHICGYEILQDLHLKALEFCRLCQNYTYDTTTYDLRNSSFLDDNNNNNSNNDGSKKDVIDWYDADLVFANSTCFPETLMDKVEEACKRLKVGSRIITFTSKFESKKHFKLIFTQRMSMSWGPATVFIQERQDNEDAKTVKERMIIESEARINQLFEGRKMER